VAEHRGGPLGSADHRRLALWAAACAEHVLDVTWADERDRRPHAALAAARAWAASGISAGIARQAALAAHAAARGTDGAARAAARAAAHAAATAHMADHCLGAAWYALEAARCAGLGEERERAWQDGQLPDTLGELVLSARALRRV